LLLHSGIFITRARIIVYPGPFGVDWLRRQSAKDRLSLEAHKNDLHFFAKVLYKIRKSFISSSAGD